MWPFLIPPPLGQPHSVFGGDSPIDIQMWPAVSFCFSVALADIIMAFGRPHEQFNQDKAASREKWSRVWQKIFFLAFISQTSQFRLHHCDQGVFTKIVSKITQNFGLFKNVDFVCIQLYMLLCRLTETSVSANTASHVTCCRPSVRMGTCSVSVRHDNGNFFFF